MQKTSDSYPIDWRRLFTSLGIQWRDRGPNTRSGNVNIRCPFCNADPSFHLAVSEEIEAFICYRDSRHAGRSFIRLLMALRNSRAQAISLLNGHPGRAQAPVAPIEVRVQSRTDRLWNSFEGAHSQPFARYLQEQRGFANPYRVIERYDLRSSNQGAWARRLLLPFRDLNNNIETWVGRAIDDARTPKYKMELSANPGAVYVPRKMRATVILCEGPLDALKVAVATEDMDVSSIATAGKNVNTAKLLRLRAACLGRNVLFVPDADVSIGERNRLLETLAGALNSNYIARLSLPEDYKDPAGMPLSLISAWIKDVI
jgi:hypothetical protein